jgi:Fe2+ or Zn2+ uptake regulation protein
MNNIVSSHECSEELQKVALKATPARLAVIKYLESINQPVDVAGILKYLEQNQVKADQATVFRMVNQFFEKGIIQRIELGEGKYRYERSSTHHHHLICTSCGRIEDVEGDFISSLEENIKNKNGFSVKAHSLEFFGICKNCQS